jgi:mannosylglycerate hydrolase MGH1-like protein
VTAVEVPGWGTWNAETPSGAFHPGLGLQVRVSAFSTRTGVATSFPYAPDVRFGPRLQGGGYAEVALPHAGSSVRLRWAGDDDVLRGAVEVDPAGEWALRFWFTLEVGFAAGVDGRVRLLVPEGEAAYVDAPVVVAHLVDGRVAAVRPDVRPVAAHHYEDPSQALREFEERGYYFRPAASDDGRWAVLRYNAVTPAVGLAAVVSGSEREAIEAVSAAVAGAARTLDERRSEAAAEGADEPARAAVRDVVGWNTVWDHGARRPYTAATRAWVAARFGGSIVWQIDTFVHVAMAARLGDARTARANLEAALACRTDTGMLAALRSPLTDWVDRSHPPIGAQVATLAARSLGDEALLERAWPVLADAYRWWWSARDGNGDGLLEYGSSPIGDGHFVHTKLGAMDESANDNSPVHDELAFDPATHTMSGADVGLNALLVHEAELLAAAARRLGRDDDADALDASAAAHAERIRRELWDEEREIFANRRWDGAFVRGLSPMSFAPLMAGVATPEQADRSVRTWLRDPERFGGSYLVAGTPHEDPASLDNVYWRGRIWPPFNWIVYRGLRRYGFDEDAALVARSGWEVFERHWAERRSYENLNQRTGQGGDSPDADPFYTWGALLATIAACELAEIDPSDGLCVGSPSSTGRTRVPVEGRMLTVDVREDGVEVCGADGSRMVTLGARGVWRDLRPGDELRVFAPETTGSARISVPWSPASASVDGLAMPVDGGAVVVPPGPAGREVVLRA